MEKIEELILEFCQRHIKNWRMGGFRTRYYIDRSRKIYIGKYEGYYVNYYITEKGISSPSLVFIMIDYNGLIGYKRRDRDIYGKMRMISLKDFKFYRPENMIVDKLYNSYEACPGYESLCGIKLNSRMAALVDISIITEDF